MATAGKILMFPVGNWTSGNNYGFLDIVYYNGSSYIAKTDITNSTTNPVTDTTNWQILAHGYMADTLSGIDGIDASGLLGTVGATVSSQTLMDKIADMVADKLVLKTAISNQQVNDTNKVTGSALAYSMNQSIIDLNSNLTALSTITNGTITMTVGTNSGSALKKKGVGICLLQLSIIISPGDIPTYTDQKIANASFHPQAGFLKNITLYSTATGNSISGRIGMNTSGDISLYVTTTIPTGGVIIQESIEYFA